MGRLVSVVLVSWNSAEFLERCLDGIAKQTYRQRELIVIDNASTDGSMALVEHGPRSSVLGPRLTVMRNEKNVGFAAAANQAIRAAKGEFVQLVNPDCFLEPDYIEKLLAAFEGEDVGMATGKLLRAGGSGIDSMGIRMTRTGRHLDITSNFELRTSNFEVFGVSGAAAMYRASFLDDVAIAGEPFDEDFFAYREDADIAWRGRLFGWRALCVPAAIAHHVRRVTPEVRRSLPPEINMHSLKNRFLLRLKNEGWYLAVRNAPFELMRDLVTIGAALTVERTSLPAFTWLWRNRRNILAERRAIQLRRRVSDRELAKWFR